MECHSIQFTTISINVERGIVKILFKYRYFQDLLIDIDIDIDISQILLIDIDIDIDIFQNHHIDIDIDIDIFGIALSISISISIFSKMTISILISISIFFKSVDISTIDMSYRYIEQGYSQQNGEPVWNCTYPLLIVIYYYMHSYNLDFCRCIKIKISHFEH